MFKDERKKPALFDGHAGTYEDDLAKGLSLTGENRIYYAEGRVRWLARLLRKAGFQPQSILDYGCGDGGTVPLLSNQFAITDVVGVDPSAQSITLACENAEEHSFEFSLLSEFPAGRSFDVIYCNGVFHHVPPEERLEVVRWVADHLNDGGVFALWENNPFNPATRLIMSRVPFDRGCDLLWPRIAHNILRQVGLQPFSSTYLFIFPRFLKLFRPLEPYLASLPLGGQYLVLAKKKEGTVCSS